MNDKNKNFGMLMFVALLIGLFTSVVLSTGYDESLILILRDSLYPGLEKDSEDFETIVYGTPDPA